MPTQRKTAQQHKLEGTYRKDRQGSHEKTDKALEKISIENATVLLPPKELTDKFVKDAYKNHSQQLLKFKLLSNADVPEFNQMYLFLQQLREVQKQICKADIAKDEKRYNYFLKMEIKLSNAYSNLAVKYFVSPSVRSKMTLDLQSIEKNKNENESVIQKMIREKK